jgi:hypothetical protein
MTATGPLSADTTDRLRQVTTATLASQLFKRGFLEAFVLDRVERGVPLPGTYPPNDATRAAYEASRRATSKEHR